MWPASSFFHQLCLSLCHLKHQIAAKQKQKGPPVFRYLLSELTEISGVQFTVHFHKYVNMMQLISICQHSTY